MAKLFRNGSYAGGTGVVTRSRCGGLAPTAGPRGGKRHPMDTKNLPTPIGTTVMMERTGETMEEMYVNMGPQHPSTHGVLRLMLKLDGEVITDCIHTSATCIAATRRSRKTAPTPRSSPTPTGWTTWPPCP